MAVERLSHSPGTRSLACADGQVDTGKLWRQESRDLPDRHREVGITVKAVHPSGGKQTFSYRASLAPLSDLQQAKLGPPCARLTNHLGGMVDAAVIDDNHLSGVIAT